MSRTAHSTPNFSPAHPTRPRLVVLDNEAVQALVDLGRIIAHLDVVAHVVRITSSGSRRPGLAVRV
jgi:hypothetical protein